ncbi:hypothetical protein PanWU01x14_049580 [Parasponia andersonii]|uniref:Uncharacterized protein n=1 Tax=Parasponia andersonii TaxID=3476 RepID=A0A2P5DMN8_PARAD|nr:hypothetical protein PanWU01x14_049580 [Parasponia andersonii]
MSMAMQIDTDLKYSHTKHLRNSHVASANPGFKLQVDAHAEEFLAQQLGPIRHINPNDVISRLADPAIRTPDLTTASQCSLNNVRTILAFLANMHLRRGVLGQCFETLLCLQTCERDVGRKLAP